MAKLLYFSGIIVFFFFGLSKGLAQNLNATLAGNLPYAFDLNDVWGYQDEAGNEYALVGTQYGFSVVDVTNASNPTEVFFQSGLQSVWRDIKTHGDYAYVTNESGNGLLIVDLSPLPLDTNLPVAYYGGSNYPFTTAHNLFIDSAGFCYLFGSDGAQGTIVLDLSNPMAPTDAGLWDDSYLHDGVVYNDTLWGASTHDGKLLVLDVGDKQNIQLIGEQTTPHAFAHNVWVSGDHKYAFTTDEKSNAYVTSYDVSDLGNIIELDRIQSTPGSGSIPHNVHYINGYLVTSYYTDGVVVFDAHRPEHLVEVAHYDTSPLSGNGFDACWGAFPWLPSGKVLGTDMLEGLFVIDFNYQRASYFVGNVYDQFCGEYIDGVKVEILSSDVSTYTGTDGAYKTGIPETGLFDVRFTKVGYDTAIVTGVQFTQGMLTTLNVDLTTGNSVAFDGVVVDQNNQPVQDVFISVVNSDHQYYLQSDAAGLFGKCSVIKGNYDITISRWGYQSVCQYNNVDFSSTLSGVVYQLEEGYLDDFSLDMGWQEFSTASAGKWERGEPIGTTHNGQQINPDFDVDGDCDGQAYVTGNGGGSFPSDDIDGGITQLISPLINLEANEEYTLEFYDWFYAEVNGPIDTLDYFKCAVIVAGDTIPIHLRNANDSMSVWSGHLYPLRNFTMADQIQILFEAGDVTSGQVVEAGVDQFKLLKSTSPLSAFSQNTSEMGYFITSDGIYLKETAVNGGFQIIDLLGRVRKTGVIGKINEPILCNDLEKGVYIFNLSYQDQKKVQKGLTFKFVWIN